MCAYTHCSPVSICKVHCFRLQSLCSQHHQRQGDNCTEGWGRTACVPSVLYSAEDNTHIKFNVTTLQQDDITTSVSADNSPPPPFSRGKRWWEAPNRRCLWGSDSRHQLPFHVWPPEEMIMDANFKIMSSNVRECVKCRCGWKKGERKESHGPVTVRN